MNDFLNIVVCVVLILLFVSFWGKLRRKIALRTFDKCIAMIKEQQYKEAVRLLQTIGNDLKFDADYWAYVAASFAGVGSKEEASHALDKAFEFDPANKTAENVAKRIGYSCK